MITEKLLLTYPDGSRFIVADADRQKLIELAPYGTTGTIVSCKQIGDRWFIVDKNQPDDGFATWNVVDAEAKESEIELAISKVKAAIRPVLAPNFKSVAERKAKFDEMKATEVEVERG